MLISGPDLKLGDSLDFLGGSNTRVFTSERGCQTIRCESVQYVKEQPALVCFEDEGEDHE